MQRDGRSTLSLDVGERISSSTTLTVNVAQNVHITTRDKIELALRKTLPMYADLGSLIGPLGVFLALFVGLVTANFQPLLGVSSETWKAIFIVSAAASAMWTVRNSWRFAKRKTLEDIVEAIVAESENQN
ncbi:hypothetical protein QLR68_00040 [Micromonospora sp. DH15]|nr:hypothetical protein [Micromonospora sp. DH15]